jgi:hypothetical protein
LSGSFVIPRSASNCVVGHHSHRPSRRNRGAVRSVPAIRPSLQGKRCA